MSKDFNDCTPILVVRDIQKSVEYYRDARIGKEPQDYPYGLRDFDVRNVDGNRLVIASPTKIPSAG